MVRLIGYLLALALATFGLALIADRPGTLTIDWVGYQVRLSVFQAVVIALFLLAGLWLLASLIRTLIQSPNTVGRYFHKRRQQQGLDALTSGMIAVGAGDRTLAARYAREASRALPNEPLTDLLRAQTAQLAGDRKTAQRVYEQMLLSPQTELLGLRGLYLDADRGGDLTAARSLAEQAMKRGNKLGWASDALFDIQCRQGDWAAAIATLAAARKNDLVNRKDADRRRAVLLTAQAQELEEREPVRAEALASEAHDLAPDLVPAAEIAGRLMASRGKMQKATSVIEQTWKRAPHPDLALVYAHARTGDSPKDRLTRVKKLAATTPGNREGTLAVANAAIEARNFTEARAALEPLLAEGLSARVCVLMARLEGGEKGDQGRVREWLARAIHAPRDPVWVADSHVSDRWAATAPGTGRLDAYEWKVAEEHTEKLRGALLLEELAEFGARTGNERSGPPQTMPVPLERGARPVRGGPAKAPTPVEDDEPFVDDDEPPPEATRKPARSADVTVLATSQDNGRKEFRNLTAAAEPNGPARRTPGGREADVEFFVNPPAPDDPGPDLADPVRKIAN